MHKRKRAHPPQTSRKSIDTLDDDMRLYLCQYLTGRCFQSLTSTDSAFHRLRDKISDECEPHLYRYKIYPTAPIAGILGLPTIMQHDCLLDLEHDTIIAQENKLNIYHKETKQLLTIDQAHMQPIMTMIPVNAHQFLSASRDNLIKLWSTDGKLQHVFMGHRNWVIALLSIEQRIISYGLDGRLRSWDMLGACRHTINLPLVYPLRRLVSISGRHFLSYTTQGEACIWDVNLQATPLIGKIPVLQSAFPYTDRTVALIGKHGQIMIYDLNGKRILNFETQISPLQCAMLMGHGNILCGFHNGEICMVNPQARKIQRLMQAKMPVIDILRLSDGRAVTLCLDQHLYIFDQNGDLSQTIATPRATTRISILADDSIICHDAFGKSFTLNATPLVSHSRQNKRPRIHNT